MLLFLVRFKSVKSYGRAAVAKQSLKFGRGVYQGLSQKIHPIDISAIHGAVIHFIRYSGAWCVFSPFHCMP